MSSDLRKSLESIQSLLSQNPSPMTATSLSSRIHRASLESQEIHHHGGDYSSSSGRTPPPKDIQSHQHSEGGGGATTTTTTIRAGSTSKKNKNNNKDHRSSVVSFRRASADEYGAVAVDDGEGGIFHRHPNRNDDDSHLLSPQALGGRDSALVHTPCDRADDVQRWQQQQQRQSPRYGFESQEAPPQPATPFQNATSFRDEGVESSNNHNSGGVSSSASSGNNARPGIVRSPSSAFSAVGGKETVASIVGTSGASIGTSPPPPPLSSGVDAGANGTPSGNHDGASATGVSSAGRATRRTEDSSRASGSDSGASKRATFDHHHQQRRRYGESDATSAAGYHPGSDLSRRSDASLLVSPISRQPTLLPASSPQPQSELSVILDGGTPVPEDGSGAFAGRRAASPPGSEDATVDAAARGASCGPAGTASPPATDPYANRHALSPPGTANDDAAQRGAAGTPLVAPSSAAGSLSGSSSKNRTPAAAGLTIHTNLQPGNGRDPTPYHHRSDRSTNTSPHSSKGGVYGQDAKDGGTTRIGLDPPAKSPFPTTINASSGHGASGTGFSFASKSAPNVHSHHYHKDHQAEEHELSMIEEDESLSAEENQSMVSNVTGPTFVRTPIGRKLHGHNKSPHNNATASGGGQSASGHSYNRPHHTPRSAAAQNFLHRTTPGSTASTTIHATPSKAELLHRPSLAMRESLAHLATTTSNALEEIWDCVGVAPDERASQLADLVERISELCEAKVQDEEAVRDQFRKEISEARKEWEEVCKSLMLDGEEDPVTKMRRDPSSKDLGRSLQLEYEAMMGRLESLRSVKQAAMTDMQASKDRILEAFAALEGCPVQEASQANEMQQFMDVETRLTQQHREAFRSKAEDYEESVASRSKAIVSLLLDCQSMIRELEIVPPCEVFVGRCEDDSKIMDSLEPIARNASSHADGHRRGQSHHYTIVSIFESPSCIGIGKSALDRLTNRIAELNGEKRRRRTKLGEMGSAIAALWSMLRVPQEEQRAFTTSIRGLGLDTLRKGEAELARLDDLKNVMIGKLVHEQRKMIEELWDKTNSSAAERASFNAYFRIHDDEQLTSEVLVKHEEYVAKLKSRLEKMQPILDHIAKREAVIEERSELELLQKDPDRLKGRYASKQLMKEEQMNRRVKKELPKITANLENALWMWYEENKPSTVNNNEEEENAMDPDLGHFMYQGSPYLRIIQYQEEQWRTRKERGEQERHRKRQEERVASSSANAVFGHTTYTKLPGKKWNPSANSQVAHDGAAASGRPRSASNLRSGSNLRPGSNMRSGGSHPTMGNGHPPRSGSNMRFGGRGPLGDASGRHNASRPPSRSHVGDKGVRGTGGVERGGKKIAAGGGRGYRPASAPRMRL